MREQEGEEEEEGFLDEADEDDEHEGNGLKRVRESGAEDEEDEDGRGNHAGKDGSLSDASNAKMNPPLKNKKTVFEFDSNYHVNGISVHLG